MLCKRCKNAKRTAAGIPTWSPTVVLICRSTAYVWQSGRDAQFSADCGRTYQDPDPNNIHTSTLLAIAIEPEDVRYEREACVCVLEYMRAMNVRNHTVHTRL